MPLREVKLADGEDFSVFAAGESSPNLCAVIRRNQEFNIYPGVGFFKSGDLRLFEFVSTGDEEPVQTLSVTMSWAAAKPTSESDMAQTRTRPIVRLIFI